MQEKELIRKIRSGDRDAFRLLYDEHAPSVLRICLRFTGKQEDAEDLCQEIFVKIYTAIRTFNARSRLSTWIYRITVNHSLNYLRKIKKTRQLLPLDHSQAAAPDRTYDLKGDTASTPERLLEEKERAHILRNAVNRLPENQRLALTLQKFEGFTCKEIAGMLECTVLSVQSRLHRAKKNLAVILQEYADHL